MTERMTEDTLRAITDQEMRAAVGFFSGKLAQQRQKAMVYYLAEAKLDLAPPEVEGRSSVISPDVRNTIESMLPQLMVKFSGSDRIVEFEAQKQGDEDKAEQATDYVNHIFHVKNLGERITYTWMKDALLSKNGIVKVWWDTRSEEKREEYKGLSDVELSQLMDDEEIEVTEQKAYPDEEDAEKRQQAVEQMTQQLQQAMQAVQQAQPQGAGPGQPPGQPPGPPPAMQAAQQLQAQIEHVQSMPPAMLYDVVCKRTKAGGRVCIENVPPEEFIISRKAKTIADASFVGHRIARSMSELKSMGYENIDNITGDDQSMQFNMERIERLGWDDEMAFLNADTQTTADASQRMVWVTECYVRVDFDGDGISELRKVVRAGNQILENEIVDCAPFISITPVPMPHKFFGLSIADLALEGQRTKTAILRGMLDNMYLSINGRTFAVDGQVNLDDLLASRPGGVVRIKQPGAVGMLDQGRGDSQLGMAMMEQMQGFLEDSTGWSRNSAGTDANALNQPVTATQAQIVTNKADMRVDLIARNFAEGFRELFRMILKLVSQYGAKEDVVKLRGEWVSVAPRDWRNGFEVSVNVGLGTGNKDQQVQFLMALRQQQDIGLQQGTATPENVYQAQAELVKALGFKSAEKFFTDPAKSPPKQQQPGPMDIERMKAQMTQQTAQMQAQLKSQGDTQAKQAELALERERMQMQAQVDTHRQQVEAQQKALEAQSAERLEQIKVQSQMQLEQFKAQMQQETAIAVAKINAEAVVVRAQLQASATPAIATPSMDAAADEVVNDDA
jgi:hypothetical protein